MLPYKRWEFKTGEGVVLNSKKEMLDIIDILSANNYNHNYFEMLEKKYPDTCFSLYWHGSRDEFFSCPANEVKTPIEKEEFIRLIESGIKKHNEQLL